jgi:hypothetical protein
VIQEGPVFNGSQRDRIFKISLRNYRLHSLMSA